MVFIKTKHNMDAVFCPNSVLLAFSCLRVVFCPNKQRSLEPFVCFALE